MTVVEKLFLSCDAFRKSFGKRRKRKTKTRSLQGQCLYNKFCLGVLIKVPDAFICELFLAPFCLHIHMNICTWYSVLHSMSICSMIRNRKLWSYYHMVLQCYKVPGTTVDLPGFIVEFTKGNWSYRRCSNKDQGRFLPRWMQLQETMIFQTCTTRWTTKTHF